MNAFFFKDSISKIVQKVKKISERSGATSEEFEEGSRQEETAQHCQNHKKLEKISSKSKSRRV